MNPKHVQDRVPPQRRRIEVEPDAYLLQHHTGKELRLGLREDDVGTCPGEAAVRPEPDPVVVRRRLTGHGCQIEAAVVVAEQELRGDLPLRAVELKAQVGQVHPEGSGAVQVEVRHAQVAACERAGTDAHRRGLIPVQHAEYRRHDEAEVGQRRLILGNEPEVERSPGA